MVETVQFDITSWSQRQKNLAHAAISALLATAGITHAGITKVSGNTFEVKDPSVSVAPVLTQVAVLARIQQIIDDSEAAQQAEQAEGALRKEELESSQLKNITLAQASAAVDAISNLAEAKVVLKRLLRYLSARKMFN